MDIEQKKSKKVFLMSFLVFVVFGFLAVYHLFLGPFGFMEERIVEIKKGMGVRQVALLLKDNGVISSESLFVAFVSLGHLDNKIALGTYSFKSPLGIIEAVRRVVKGDYGIQAKKITIPEGFTNVQIAKRLQASLQGFDVSKFLTLASTSEGYLYPETYFFLPSDSERVIFKKMISTFDDETSSLAEGFQKSLRSKEEIVIMASILEKEVQTPKDKQIVSGILWNRIKMKMPLQVDATLAYERDKDSYTLTLDDLRKDSIYNTYTRKGLPPTPISNPGIDSIFAALNPISTNYVYFLTDREGNVYYAKTYAEHLKNKAKYM